MQLVLYSKPGCHLCEGLQEKLEAINNIKFDLEVRDITTREDWFAAYEYEVPVLFIKDETEEKLRMIPRPSPRISAVQLEKIIQKYL